MQWCRKWWSFPYMESSILQFFWTTPLYYIWIFQDYNGEIHLNVGLFLSPPFKIATQIKPKHEIVLSILDTSNNAATRNVFFVCCQFFSAELFFCDFVCRLVLFVVVVRWANTARKPDTIGYYGKNNFVSFFFVDAKWIAWRVFS